MCEFCLLFDFGSYRAKVDNGVASLVKAPTEIPFLPKQQFAFCPVCGSPRSEESMPTGKFPQNLRRIRRMRGFTQEALGRKLGVQKSAVCKYEKGRAVPNTKQLQVLCRVLNVSPQELI